MTRIIHITPQVPSAICGVGDYAEFVGRKIEELWPEVRCGYVACGYRAPERAEDGPRIRDATGSCDGSRLWQAIGEVADEFNVEADGLSLVLHYSGYGYHQGGAPDWLADALERRPIQFSDVRTVTMFHELYATGWPWQRAFWNSSRQRTAAIRIAQLSDAVLTNVERSARWLEEVTGRAIGSVPSLPIPSNIGEPCEIPVWESRPAQAVTFGGARFKESFLLGRGATETAKLCRKLGIRTLLCVGVRAKVEEQAFRASGIDVIQTGFLTAEDVSSKYSSARIAFVDYFPNSYAKSSVLAAAAAHGAPPIFPRSKAASDGLQFGEQLWDLKSALAADRDDACARLSSISRSVRAWYEGHRFERHAALLAEVARPGITHVV